MSGEQGLNWISFGPRALAHTLVSIKPYLLAAAAGTVTQACAASSLPWRRVQGPQAAQGGVDCGAAGPGSRRSRLVHQGQGHPLTQPPLALRSLQPTKSGTPLAGRALVEVCLGSPLSWGIPSGP